MHLIESSLIFLTEPEYVLRMYIYIGKPHIYYGVAILRTADYSLYSVLAILWVVHPLFLVPTQVPIPQHHLTT